MVLETALLLDVLSVATDLFSLRAAVKFVCQYWTVDPSSTVIDTSLHACIPVSAMQTNATLANTTVTVRLLPQNATTATNVTNATTIVATPVAPTVGYVEMTQVSEAANGVLIEATMVYAVEMDYLNSLINEPGPPGDIPLEAVAEQLTPENVQSLHVTITAMHKNVQSLFGFLEVARNAFGILRQSLNEVVIPLLEPGLEVERQRASLVVDTLNQLGSTLYTWLIWAGSVVHAAAQTAEGVPVTVPTVNVTAPPVETFMEAAQRFGLIPLVEEAPLGPIHWVNQTIEMANHTLRVIQPLIQRATLYTATPLKALGAQSVYLFRDMGMNNSIADSIMVSFSANASYATLTFAATNPDMAQRLLRNNILGLLPSTAPALVDASFASTQLYLNMAQYYFNTGFQTLLSDTASFGTVLKEQLGLALSLATNIVRSRKAQDIALSAVYVLVAPYLVQGTIDIASSAVGSLVNSATVGTFVRQVLTSTLQAEAAIRLTWMTTRFLAYVGSSLQYGQGSVRQFVQFYTNRENIKFIKDKAAVYRQTGADPGRYPLVALQQSLAFLSDQVGLGVGFFWLGNTWTYATSMIPDIGLPGATAMALIAFLNAQYLSRQAFRTLSEELILMPRARNVRALEEGGAPSPDYLLRLNHQIAVLVNQVREVTGEDPIVCP